MRNIKTELEIALECFDMIANFSDGEMQDGDAARKVADTFITLVGPEQDLPVQVPPGGTAYRVWFPSEFGLPGRWRICLKDEHGRWYKDGIFLHPFPSLDRIQEIPS